MQLPHPNVFIPHSGNCVLCGFQVCNGTRYAGMAKNVFMGRQTLFTANRLWVDGAVTD